MYELYYMPTTASLSIHWVLHYLSQNFNVSYKLHLVSFPKAQQKEPAFKSVNPMGRVPTLVIDGEEESLTESIAILLYLADQHPEARLAPKDRKGYYEMMVYIANNLLPSFRDWFYAGRDCPKEDAAGVKNLAIGKINRAWDWLDAKLGGKEWLCGVTGPTVADFMVVSITGWNPWVREMATQRANLKRLVEKMEKREDWIEVRKRETEVEEKL